MNPFNRSFPGAPFDDGAKRQRRRNVIVYCATILFSILFIVFGRHFASQGTPVFTAYASQLVVQAKVTEVMYENKEETVVNNEVLVTTTTYFRAAISEGEHKGTVVTAYHLDDPFSPYYLRPVRSGDNVFLQYDPDSNEDSHWALQEYRRTDYLLYMGAFVVLLMLLFGRIHGIHTIVSLVFTCLSIFVVFIPSILSGHNIYLWTVIVGVFIIAMTILIVNGPNMKSLCSAVGCLCGFLAAGLMTAVMDRVLGLTGLIDEDAVFLLYLNPESPINLRAIIFGAVTIGALGAIMDVAISISSSLFEVHQADPWLERKDIMRSGMNIGRDIIGTMSNTLLLAYIGSSLSLVVLLTAYNDSLIVLLNKEMIVVEILQAMVGVAALLLVIPLTSLVCACVYTRPSERNRLR